MENKVVIIGVGDAISTEIVAAERRERQRESIIMMGRGSKSLTAIAIMEHYLISGDIHFPGYPKGSPTSIHRPLEKDMRIIFEELGGRENLHFIPEIPKQNFNKFGKPKHLSGSTFHR